MHRTMQVLVVAVFASGIMLIAGCAPAEIPKPTPGPIRVDATADGTTIQLAKGAELSVALEGNPTTGYDWKVPEALPAQLVAKSDTLESTADPGVVGAGGVRVFTYTATATGTGVLELEYVRSWEKGVPPLETFTLTVVVK